MCPEVDVIFQIEYSQSVLVKGTSQESGRVEEDKDTDTDTRHGHGQGHGRSAKVLASVTRQRLN